MIGKNKKKRNKRRLCAQALSFNASLVTLGTQFDAMAEAARLLGQTETTWYTSYPGQNGYVYGHGMVGLGSDIWR